MGDGVPVEGPKSLSAERVPHSSGAQGQQTLILKLLKQEGMNPEQPVSHLLFSCEGQHTRTQLGICWAPMPRPYVRKPRGNASNL